MSQMSQLSQMSHVFQIPIRQWGPQLLLLLPQTDPLQSSHHNFLSFGPIPTNFIPIWKALLMEILMMPSKSPEPPAVEWFLSFKVCVLGKLFFGRTKWQTMSPHPPVPCKMEAVAPPDHTFSQGQPHYPLPCRMEATAQPHHTFPPNPKRSPLANVLIMAQQVASLPLSNRTKRSSSRESNAPNSSHFG